MLNIKNKLLLIFISFAFIYMGISDSLVGMINKSLSLYFHNSGSYFVALNGFILVIAVLFSVLYRYIAKFLTIKSIFLMVFILFTLLNSGLYLSLEIKSIYLYSMFTLMLGIPIGVVYPLLNEGLYLLSNNQKQHFNLTCFEHALWSIGFFFGSIVINSIIELLDFKIVYLFMVIMSWLFFMAIWIKVKNIDRASNLKNGHLKLKTRKILIRNYFLVLLLGLTFTAITSFQSSFEYWMPNYIKSLNYINPEFYGLIIGAYGIGQFISRVYFSVKFNLKQDIRTIISRLYCLLLLSVMILLFPLSEMALLSFCFLLGIFSGPIIPAIIADGMSDQANGSSEKAVSTIIAFGTLGPVVSIWFSSWVFYKISFQYVCTLLFILVLIGFILYSIKSYFYKKPSVKNT